MSIIKINTEKCDLSYSCVRVCPVKAIEIKANTNFAKIIPERCIGCGACIAVCPNNAIEYEDSKETTKKILQSDNKTVAIVDPSISGEFNDITDYRKFVQMIRELGFDYVNEISFGADIISLKYKELLKEFKGKYYITSACPVVVSYIEKYKPELINNLTPLVSPMVATAMIVRKLYGKEIKVISIGPCIENKNESKYYKDDKKIDTSISFTELRELFKEFNITESKLEYSDFDSPIGYKGSLFPISNGILQAGNINENLLDGNIITSEGKNNVKDVANQFYKDINSIKKHFNLFFCKGCIMGPGMSAKGRKFTKSSMVTKYAGKRLKNFDKGKWEKEITKYFTLDYSRKYANNDQRIESPSQEKINEVLKIIGKTNSIRGCNACGYNTCTEFAIAVSKGLAKTEMCLSYALQNKHEYIDALSTTNKKLANTKKALIKSEKEARTEKEIAIEASETVNTLLQKLPSGFVILNKNLKIIQSNKSFIKLLGEEAESINEVIPGLEGADLKTLLPYNIYNLFNNVISDNKNLKNKDVHIKNKLLNLSIFVINKNKTAGAVFRDMYAPEIRKEEVINRVTDVIDKNLKMVQKIGFLLGEEASETEQMLNSIIEFYKSEDK
ncbi:MAG: [Fe-Fe] hydrogenase large subunit C-terminal domain-containing protein [Bacteroidota bacterium]|nr:[Fe-Fe] hydrogenase large subunit C-terminal domain-containing protein [Bacteroidota bacterium]